MTIGYGISGIGYNPLGNYGLGMSGQYGSYDAYMPSMMGMNYGSGLNYGMGMGMYYPTFMAQQQNQVEQMQLQHAGNMHTQLLNNEVTANRETNSALVQKMLTDGDIQVGVQNLYAKVRAGDQDGICEEFDKLKSYVYNTYQDEFKARGDKINPYTSATRLIEAVYGQIISAQEGTIHSLRDDIPKYGENALEQGFMSGFKGGHSSRYIDETMSHCFDLGINDKGSQDMHQLIGKGAGYTASILQKGAYGAIAGGVAAAGGLAVLKGANKAFKDWQCIKDIKFGKTMGKFAILGAIAGVAADIFWKASS